MGRGGAPSGQPPRKRGTLEPAVCQGGSGVLASTPAYLGVPAHRPQPAMAEQLRGQSRIPELLFDGGPKGVPELVWMPALKTEATRHLVAYIPSATRRKPVLDRADHPALEPDEEGGGGGQSLEPGTGRRQPEPWAR